MRGVKLIAVGGLKGSGKDTAAKMLQYILNSPKLFRTYFWYKIFNKFPGKWKITAFAKPLKEVLSVIIGVHPSQFEDRNFKEGKVIDLKSAKIYDNVELYGISQNRFNKIIKTGEPIDEPITIRQLMQYFGTEVCRRFIGENVWINATLNNLKGYTIVSDLRFRNELDAIHKNDGIAIYINRDSCQYGMHPSEREVVELYNTGQFDYIINNNLQLKDLFNNLKTLSF